MDVHAPGETQAVELRVADASVSDVTITLSEPICTGTGSALCLSVKPRPNS